MIASSAVDSPSICATDQRMNYCATLLDQKCFLGTEYSEAKDLPTATLAPRKAMSK